jgi:thimet oligopeptidase
LNTDEVKQYFEMNNTLQGMFNIYEKLLNLQIKETKNIPVWHAKVKSFELYKDGKKSGSFYLDLYYRKNKFLIPSIFSISYYHRAKNKEVLPVSALICSFPERNDKEPSLLNHSNVITLFHEFGHLIHAMLGRSDIASQHPFALKYDFIEAPSQLLENWCWEYEPLKLFARHYKTSEVLPEPLFNKMKLTQLVGRGIFTMNRLYTGIQDFTFHDKFDSINGKDLTQVSKDLSAMEQLPFAEGSHRIYSSAQLNLFGAQFYRYLWSEVFAMDLFTMFQKSGVMNTVTGIRYRKEILEKGATMEEIDMLRNFLGREPNSDAFLKSLGVQ